MAKRLRFKMGSGKALRTLTHLQCVRILYKTILKIHRGLPMELRELGDQYTRDEFRRHKEATPEQAQIFMEEWTKYAVTVVKQLRISSSHSAKVFGTPLKGKDLDQFSDEQIYQLFELHEAATKKETNATSSENDK
ncbi:succinate dehydrogenase assembly factor 3, mitochondrial isoform X2 [Cherax quadricarinatus]|uniref:succinate dehydrogenase assembly factor 3, mitochondrial isoform X2 n=1 Tax=Cherax quadricarinatus TaxID=27406 RepID=UPI00387EE007